MYTKAKWLYIFLLISLLMGAGCTLSFPSGGEPAPGEDKNPGATLAAPGYDIAWLLETARDQWGQVPRHFLRDPIYPGSLPAPEDVLDSANATGSWHQAYSSRQWQTVTMGIYTGPGAEPAFWQAIAGFLDQQGVAWDTFDHTELGDIMSRFDAVWFGGGFSSQYRTGITHHHLLRDFVREGGTFIGICAGAYYAASTMHWQGGTTDYPLKLLEGAATGPLDAVSWGESTTVQLTENHPANQNTGTEVGVYYMDGPYFTWQEARGVQTLATYATNQQPAVITFPYGRGRALLIGPHPEMGYDQQTGEFTTDGSHSAQWGWLRNLVTYSLCY